MCLYLTFVGCSRIYKSHVIFTRSMNMISSDIELTKWALKKNVTETKWQQIQIDFNPSFNDGYNCI